MKNLTIYLNNGMQFTAEVEGYDATEFAVGLNNPQITVVSIGDIVLNRHAILMVVPTDAVTQVPVTQ